MSFPLGSQILEKEIYADDVLIRDFTLNGEQEKQEQVINLLNSSGFKFRKWLANHRELIEWLPSNSTWIVSKTDNLTIGIIDDS